MRLSGQATDSRGVETESDAFSDYLGGWSNLIAIVLLLKVEQPRFQGQRFRGQNLKFRKIRMERIDQVVGF